jgi:hypothetical protein
MNNKLIGVAAVALCLLLAPRAHADCFDNSCQIACTQGVTTGDQCLLLLETMNKGKADGPHCFSGGNDGNSPICNAPTGHGGYYCDDYPPNPNQNAVGYGDGTCCYIDDATHTFCGSGPGAHGECCNLANFNAGGHCNGSGGNWAACKNDENGNLNPIGMGPQNDYVLNGTQNDFSFGCPTDLNTDIGHCGSCSTLCSKVHNTPTCSGGVCALGGCTGGYDNCDGDTTNGCETNIISGGTLSGGAIPNCGHCGGTCGPFANGTASCSNFSCTETCTNSKAGGHFGDCDNNTANGCETDLNAGKAPSGNTILDCGSCTSAGICTTPHSTPTCTKGVCGHGACDPGYADCNGVAADGCETNLAANPNCGVCGRTCDVNTTLCSPSPSPVYVCAGTGCGPGLATCPTGGSCGTAITTVTNCGGCGITCSNIHIPTPTCVTGVCGGTCAAGFADCDNTLGDGCEVDINTDVANCGACNHACNIAGAVAQCAAGVCGYVTCIAGYNECDGDLTNGCEVHGPCPVAHDLADAPIVDMAVAVVNNDGGSTGSTGSTTGAGGADMAMKGKGKSGGCDVGGPGSSGLGSLLLLLALATTLQIARRRRVATRSR